MEIRKTFSSICKIISKIPFLCLTNTQWFPGLTGFKLLKKFFDPRNRNSWKYFYRVFLGCGIFEKLEDSIFLCQIFTNLLALQSQIPGSWVGRPSKTLGSCAPSQWPSMGLTSFLHVFVQKLQARYCIIWQTGRDSLGITVSKGHVSKRGVIRHRSN